LQDIRHACFHYKLLHNTNVNKSLYMRPKFTWFHSKCGINKWLIKGEAQQFSYGCLAEGQTRPTPLTYIHTKFR
jgi:hypothetical protein